ncbi:branched-chain amino acid ABC transporter permease [Oceanicella sp. SM1341]|uniref:branched-chain amino acid ABC transporter permease n=1 Tax=Oceanicella sp. SM1341 TaxID=1548889 RepID=UPI000E4DC356|nr:branched-chain amino acid ABC transporter permease [Oceanicella sp. SM1341]
MEAYGYGLYLVTLLSAGGIYAILALGLNVQWGFGGLFNAGIAGFFAVGAYASAILTTAATPEHLGGFGLPLALGAVAAMAVSALIAWGIGRICIRLRSDYLAIATIGIAEILRLVLKNEGWATNGPRGINRIPKAFEGLPEPWAQLGFLAMVLLTVLALYLLLERAWRSPWGRVMTAIRDSEAAARAAGKNVERFRVQAFVLGAAVMGLAGAYYAQYIKFIGPDATDPLTATFLVWVMLIAGGSGNNRGAILGAFLIWTVWSATEIFTPRLLGLLAGLLPADLAAELKAETVVRSAYLRVFLIGLVLQVVLQRYARGILPETRPAVAAAPPPAAARERG